MDRFTNSFATENFPRPLVPRNGTDANTTTVEKTHMQIPGSCSGIMVRDYNQSFVAAGTDYGSGTNVTLTIPSGKYFVGNVVAWGPTNFNLNLAIGGFDVALSSTTTNASFASFPVVLKAGETVNMQCGSTGYINLIGAWYDLTKTNCSSIGILYNAAPLGATAIVTTNSTQCAMCRVFISKSGDGEIITTNSSGSSSVVNSPAITGNQEKVYGTTSGTTTYHPVNEFFVPPSTSIYAAQTQPHIVIGCIFPKSLVSV